MWRWGGGGGAFMLMHETRMKENYDLKWFQTWPLFFIFYTGKPEENPSFSSTLFLFFLLSPKKRKNRMRNKKENWKEQNRKRMPFSIVNKFHFWGFFGTPKKGAPPFCVYDNSTRLVSYFRLCMQNRNFLCVFF